MGGEDDIDLEAYLKWRKENPDGDEPPSAVKNGGKNKSKGDDAYDDEDDE